MTRCAGSQGTGFACMVAGKQEPLDAARSACAVVSALAGVASWSVAGRRWCGPRWSGSVRGFGLDGVP